MDAVRACARTHVVAAPRRSRENTNDLFYTKTISFIKRKPIGITLLLYNINNILLYRTKIFDNNRNDLEIVRILNAFIHVNVRQQIIKFLDEITETIRP